MVSGPFARRRQSPQNEINLTLFIDVMQGFHDRLFSDDPDNSLHGEDHSAARESPEGRHGTRVARSGRRRHMARSIHASVISGRIL